MSETIPFDFYTEAHLVEVTGLKAKNLAELVDIIHAVPGSSIFFHTHYEYLSHHFEKPPFYNDFALWVSSALQEPRLGERLAAIDFLSFPSIRQLREAILAAIEGHLHASNLPLRECPPGEELHFCKAKSFIMPTGIRASDTTQFLAVLPSVSHASVFFHFFGARLRLERATNDFSAWLQATGHEKMARAIDKIDPYAVTLDELKMEIIKVGQVYLGGST
jgi:hypothetical protein